MNVKKTISIILVCIWMSVVFSFSNQQGKNSSNISRKASEIIVNIIDIQNKYTNIEKEEQVKKVEPIIRKLAHYTIYMVGGSIIMNCMMQFCKKEKVAIGCSLLIGIFYAMGDEMHQLLVVGRSGNIKDIIIDSLGIGTGIFVYLLVIELIFKIRSRGEENKGGEQIDCRTI